MSVSQSPITRPQSDPLGQSIGTKLILEQIQNIQIPIIEGEKGICVRPLPLSLLFSCLLLVVPVIGILGYHIHSNYTVFHYF